MTGNDLKRGGGPDRPAPHVEASSTVPQLTRNGVHEVDRKRPAKQSRGRVPCGGHPCQVEKVPRPRTDTQRRRRDLRRHRRPRRDTYKHTGPRQEATPDKATTDLKNGVESKPSDVRIHTRNGPRHDRAKEAQGRPGAERKRHCCSATLPTVTPSMTRVIPGPAISATVATATPLRRTTTTVVARRATRGLAPVTVAAPSRRAVMSTGAR